MIDEEQRTLERFVHEHPDEEDVKIGNKEGVDKASSSKDVPTTSHEVETLMIAMPMKSKKAPEVLGCIQEITIRLERKGLIVRRLHTDRGTEFVNRALQTW